MYLRSILTSKGGAVVNDSNVPVVVKVPCKGRISLKDIGVVRSSSLYLKQGVDKNIAADHHTIDSHLRGIITELPNQKLQDVLPDEGYNIDLMEMDGKFKMYHCYQYDDLE